MEAKILTFGFEAELNDGLDIDVLGIVNETINRIDVIVPVGLNLNGLIATFTHSTSTSVYIEDVQQNSRVTPNDFRVYQTYIVVPTGEQPYYNGVNGEWFWNVFVSY